MHLQTFALVSSILLGQLQIEGKWEVIPYKQVMEKGASVFDQEKSLYTTMVYDKTRNRLVIGATNLLFLLNSKLEEIDRDVFAPSAEDIKRCVTEQGHQAGCRVYPVKWLSIQGQKLYVCGAKAFSPACDIRSSTNIKTKLVEGPIAKYKTPSEPSARVAYFVENDMVYVGTLLDPDLKEGAIILSHFTDPNFNPVRTIIPKDEGDFVAESWLNSPVFIGAFEAGRYVYFVFVEGALEHGSQDEDMRETSRVGRVCKDDRGGTGDMAGVWGSFVKATLSCPGYDMVNEMDFGSTERTLYTLFTDREMSVGAICKYELNAIESAFEGTFKYGKKEAEPWTDVEKTKIEGSTVPKVETCFGPRTVTDTKNLHLMSVVIKPSCGRPIYKIKDKHFSALHILFKTRQGMPQKNLTGYFGDSEGSVWKFVLSSCSVSEPVEVWEVIPNDLSDTERVITSIIVVENTIYFLTSTRVTAVPLEINIVTTNPTPTPTQSLTPSPSLTPFPSHGYTRPHIRKLATPVGYTREKRLKTPPRSNTENYGWKIEDKKRRRGKMTPPFFEPTQDDQKANEDVIHVRSRGVNPLHPALLNVLKLSTATIVHALFLIRH